MTQQDIAKAGIELIPDLTDRNYTTKPMFGPPDMFTRLIAALHLLEPVAAGTSVIVPVELTEDMMNAGLAAWIKTYDHETTAGERTTLVYSAEIAAAQEPKP